MQAREIINTILSKEQITGAQLAKDIGLARPQAIYDILNGKVARVSVRMANLIHSAKPIYNLDWLLTGNGAIFDGDIKQESVSRQLDPMSIIGCLVESNTKKDEELRLLRQSYERLVECYERLSNKDRDDYKNNTNRDGNR